MAETITAGFALSPRQKQLCLAHADAAAYRTQVGLSITGTVDADALRAALETVVGRHEILRTTFSRQTGMRVPLQAVHETLTPQWGAADLSALSEGEQKTAIEAAAQVQLQADLDLQNGPLLRADLLTLSADQGVLLLCLPTLCADVQTLLLLAREVAAVYGGQADTLPEEPLQYADFAEWQNQLLETEDENYTQAQSYWKQHDPAQLAPIALPFEKAAGEDTPFKSKSLPVALADADLVKAAAEQNGVPVSDFVMASFVTVLARLAGEGAGEEAMRLDYVTPGRSYEELEDALGLFARPLPIGVTIAEGTDTIGLAKTLREAIAEAETYQEYVPGGEGQFAPVVQFAWMPVPENAGAGSLPWSVARLHQAADRFVLLLEGAETAGGLALSLSYDPARLDEATAVQIAEHLATALASASANPVAPVESLAILSDAQRDRIVYDWNETAADYPQDTCFHTLFEAQAASAPDRPAVRYGDTAMTYAELNARANQVAHYLRDKGVGPDTCVALFMERSTETVAALLGIMKAGGAYVPLHPEHPKPRLSFQLEQISAPVIITQDNLSDRLPEFSGAILRMDDDAATLDAQPAANPDTQTTPSNIVYVIYTSGSTGTPKGVAVTHRGLVNYTHYMMGRLELSAPEAAQGYHFGLVSALTADLGHTCVYPSLASGGCLHLIAHDTTMDAGAFEAYTSQYPLDVLKITPSHLRALLSSVSNAASSSILPRAWLVLGGEASAWELIGQIRMMGTCRILNHYGPTETTIGSLTYRVGVTEGEEERTSYVPIGKPIANTKVYILDKNRQPVPVGAIGELCIGGAGVARGYLNRLDLTVERFVDNPFTTEAEQRIYRTGDLARWLPDGNVEFLGRVDDQVKIRGFRVEPEEIAGVLRDHPGVREAAVLAREDSAGDKRLTAFVTSSAAAAPVTGEELRAYLQSRMPEYMVPAGFVVVDSLPLTGSGKVDRQALLRMEADKAAQTAEKVLPRNPTEQGVADIWAEVLAVESVSIHDNFFELGGHSLLVTQVIARLRSVFQVQLPVRAFFEAPTVAGLAETVQEQQPAASEEEEMAKMLAELEGLSDEEVERMLAGETS